MVEDEERLARALKRGLEAEGFVVDLAADGPAGLEAARYGDYAAVILDIMLPRLSGYRVVQALRAERNWVPVLMLSAKDGEYDQADGLDAGADDYLTKPFSYVVLLARLRALLRRGAPERPAVLAVGDLTLDPASREVARAGVGVSLTAREYSLLEYLMRHHGEALSKIAILDHVWEAGADTDPNVVEVYVGYLRRKIDTPFGRRSVRTVRGVGYRIVDDLAGGTGRTGSAGATEPGRGGSAGAGSATGSGRTGSAGATEADQTGSAGGAGAGRGGSAGAG